MSDKIRRALIVVDVQNDFCEGGSLGVDGGNDVAEKIAEYIVQKGDLYDVITFTADDHLEPPNDNGGHFALPPAEPDFVDTWPVHCVQGTEGAEYHPALKFLAARYPLFKKGQGRPDYSGFQGFRDEDGFSLEEYLTAHDITHVDVVGIAGDYCVSATAFDAVDEGFVVEVLGDMVSSVKGHEATVKCVKDVQDRQYVSDGE